jgi:hypothetical protein
LRLSSGEHEIGLAKPLVKVDRLRLEAVWTLFTAPAGRAMLPDLRRNIEHQCQIRAQIADRNPLKGLDQARVYVTELALINTGGIGETIADDPVSRSQGRLDRAANMVVAGGGEQHGFRLGTKRLGGTRKKDMAHDLGAGRTAWLSRELHPDAERFKLKRQHGGLGRFASPLPAFEGNELSSHQTDPIRAHESLPAETAALLLKEENSLRSK